MQAITAQKAIDYAARKESEWGLSHSLLGTQAYRLGGADVIDVFTSENRWSVWVDESGAVYGEC